MTRKQLGIVYTKDHKGILFLGWTRLFHLITMTQIDKHATMADFRIFITAASADFRVVNELLLYLRDWEYGSGDTFHLQTSNTIDERVRTSESSVSVPVAIPGTITAATFLNAWAGASIEEVETFATQELDSIVSPQAHVSFFLVLDDQGVEDHTVLCIAKDEPEDSDGDAEDDGQDKGDGEQEDTQSACRGSKLTEHAATQYNKVRMPWNAAYLFCANLGEANMGFEEFCDQDIGPDEQLYWSVNKDLAEDDTNSDDALKRRAGLLRRLWNEDML